MFALFVYGSLMDLDVFSAITGVSAKAVSATLFDYARFQVIGESYPCAIHQIGNQISGILYSDLSQESIDKLDLFEGEEYRRITVEVSVQSQTIEAQFYCYNESFSHRVSLLPWDFHEFVTSQKAAFLQLCKSSNYTNSRFGE